jgi:CDP-diacylglycerol--serine O-phosphatidyltransferase
MYEMQTFLKKADILTFLNILFGFMAIVFILRNDLDLAARLIIVAVVVDGFDGYFARKTKTESEFGMNFDSLSDCISFGVAPALLMYTISSEWWIIPFSLIYVASGVLRLARYNVSFKDMEEGTFIGMPIPIGALLMVLAFFGDLPSIAMAGTALLASYLMVCSINFTKMTTGKFPVQNRAVLALAVVPVIYLVPVARLAYAGCVGGIVIKKKRQKK